MFLQEKVKKTLKVNNHPVLLDHITRSEDEHHFNYRWPKLKFNPRLWITLGLQKLCICKKNTYQVHY